MAAEARAQERARLRQERAEQNFVAYQQRLAAIEEASQRVAEFDDQIRRLTTLHAECAEAVDWEQMAVMPDPIGPEENKALSNRLRHELDSYAPSILDRVLFRVQRKRDEFTNQMLMARKREVSEYQEACAQWERDLLNADALRKQAKRVLDGDDQAWKSAAQTLCPLSPVNAIANSAHIRWDSPRLAEITLLITGDEVIPDAELTLTKLGKISEKTMRQKKKWEMYEDLVCAAAIRASRELFAALPFESISVHCTASMPNRQTGAIEENTVLSVHYPREAFLSLNFQLIDPSESMVRFLHNKDFKRGEGFRPVERVVVTQD